MNVHQPSHLPKLPTVPLNGRGVLQTEIAYEAPETKMVTLGYLPGDVVSPEVAGATYTEYHGQVYSGRSSRQLFTQKPKLDASGQPIFASKVKQFTVDTAPAYAATPPSVPFWEA